MMETSPEPALRPLADQEDEHDYEDEDDDLPVADALPDRDAGRGSNPYRHVFFVIRGKRVRKV